MSNSYNVAGVLLSFWNLIFAASGPLNECETNNGGCAQICIDTATSFQCSCNTGYTLNINGRSCNG